jgi:hypothetical protein
MLENPWLDLPASPSISPAVLDGSTSRPGSRTSLRICSEEVGAHAVVEAANGNVGEPETADESIIAALKECIPKGSNSIWEEVIHDWWTQVAARLNDEDKMSRFWAPEDFWKQIDEARPSGHSVLVIDNINDDWCDALCTRFPETINRRFLLEHILGLQAGVRWSHNGADESPLERSVAADLERLYQAFPCLSNRATEGWGGHVDCWLDADDQEHRVRRIYGCSLSLTEYGWVQTNRYLSYCELKENLCKSDCPKLQRYRA